ncbi:MAG: hypothetical protein IIY93_01015 [Clostridia bacterium]|nr:hypothetical protein [Clostridia bacterium]
MGDPGNRVFEMSLVVLCLNSDPPLFLDETVHAVDQLPYRSVLRGSGNPLVAVVFLNKFTLCADIANLPPQTMGIQSQTRGGYRCDGG